MKRLLISHPAPWIKQFENKILLSLTSFIHCSIVALLSFQSITCKSYSDSCTICRESHSIPPRRQPSLKIPHPYSALQHSFALRIFNINKFIILQYFSRTRFFLEEKKRSSYSRKPSSFCRKKKMWWVLCQKL